MQNSYLSLDAEGRRRHDVLDGFGETARIINGVYRLEVRPTKEFPSPLTLIPSYPDLPMEDVYPRVPHTRPAKCTSGNRAEAASCISRGMSIARSGTSCVSIICGCCRTSIRWATNEPPPVVVEGPG